MISLKTYLSKKLELEKMFVFLQKLNIPKDSNYDEFMKYLLKNKDYKSFCQEENSKEAQKVYQRIQIIQRKSEGFKLNFQKTLRRKKISFHYYLSTILLLKSRCQS